MADVIISPNMNLPVPVVTEDPGPDWAQNVNGCMSGIDAHNHSSGQGVPITPAGISITADLPMNNNNLTTPRSVNFTAQSVPLAAAADIGCVYVSGKDLYFNDEDGNQIRITQGGSVTGSTGTITGLPSGTASASFAAGTFTFQSATNTPATMAVGPLIVGRNAASSKTVTITPNAAQAANYDLTLPTALPAATALLTVSNTGSVGASIAISVSSNQCVVTNTAGNLTSAPFTGIGPNVVTDVSPTITTPAFVGKPTGTITNGTYTPTVTSGGTGTDQTGTANSFRYLRTGDFITVFGQIRGTTDSLGLLKTTLTLPVAPTSNFTVNTELTGTVSPLFYQAAPDGFYGNGIVFGVVGAKTATVWIQSDSVGVDCIQNICFLYSAA